MKSDRGSQFDGLLQVGGYLGIDFVGRSPRQVLRFGLQHQRHAVEHLGEIEEVPCTEELDLAEQLVLLALTTPPRHLVHRLDGIVGTVDTGIALLPERLHPVDIGIHQPVHTLGTDVTLAATAQTVVGSDIENKEGILLRIGQIAVHHRVDAIHHLHGVGLIDGEVGSILHRQVLRVEEVVTGD